MEVFRGGAPRGRGADFPRLHRAPSPPPRRGAPLPREAVASGRRGGAPLPRAPGRHCGPWVPGAAASPGRLRAGALRPEPRRHRSRGARDASPPPPRSRARRHRGAEVRVVDVPGAANALRFVMVPGTLPAASLVRLRAAAPLLANAALVARSQFPVLDWRYQHLGDVAGTALLQALDKFRGGVAALRVIARLPLDAQRSVLAELHLPLGALYRRRVTVLPLLQHKEEGRVKEPGPGGVAMVEQNAAEVDEAPVENGQLAEEVQDQHGAAAEHAQELLDEDAHAAQQEAELRQAKIDIAECLLLEAYDHMMAKKGDVRRLVAEMNEARANRNWDDPIV